MKTEDNIIKNLNSILSEQTMNSVFNDTDIINLVKNMKVEIEENIEDSYENESSEYKEEVDSLDKYIELSFEDEATTVINKFLGSKDDKYCWNFVTTSIFSSNLKLDKLEFSSTDANIEPPFIVRELNYFMRQISFTILYTLIKEKI
jgi:hypothetical protein